KRLGVEPLAEPPPVEATAHELRPWTVAARRCQPRRRWTRERRERSPRHGGSPALRRLFRTPTGPPPQPNTELRGTRDTQTPPRAAEPGSRAPCCRLRRVAYRRSTRGPVSAGVAWFEALAVSLALLCERASFEFGDAKFVCNLCPGHAGV